MNSCKEKNGKVIEGDEEVLGRWAEHFENLLNVEGGEEIERPVYVTVEPEDAGPTLEEVEEAVKHQRNERAPGGDQLTAELLKCGGPYLIRYLHRLIIEIWERGEMPEEWKTGLICPIFKKGDKLNCSNYRGVTLRNVAYKVFFGILQRRLSCYAEEILGEYQCGFRPGRSTTDQIFIMRQSMEKCFEYDVDLHKLFIDFQQAFDSIRRRELLNVMGFRIP
jgi:sorting nexin-29